MQILAVALVVVRDSHGTSPSSEETERARQWVADKIDGAPPDLPFSFTYGGRSSRELLPLASQAERTWRLERDEQKLDEQRTQRILTYTDGETGMEVRCEAVVYADYPAVEWLVTLQNNGDVDTPIIEDVLAMDVSLTRPGPGEPATVGRWMEWNGRFEPTTVREEPGEFVVHHATGGIFSEVAFEPHDDVLGPDQHLTIGGISSEPDLPFFNVEWPQQGLIAGVGWTAPWRADFVRDHGRLLSAKVAMTEWTAPWKAEHMRGVHFLLHPGEHIRIPRMLVMFWDGDRIRGHNLWRRLLLEHYSPRRHGELVQVPTGGSSEWHSQEQAIEIIDWYAEHDLPIEYYWMDLGWQREPNEEESREYLTHNVPNEKLIPDGVRAISVAAHRHGIKYLLWFGGNENCPWEALYPVLDRVRKYRPELLSEEHPGRDSGNPMINRYMIDFYTRAIAEWGIDIFRYDGRSTPPPDTREDRRGINWARSAEGLLEFWDALLERFPDLVIDCCGGGAVNLDLETIQRSVFLWRCDYQCHGIHDPENVFDPIGMQTQTHGISLWAPLTGGAIREMTDYAFRSAYSPGVNMSMPDVYHRPFEEYLDPDLARKHLTEYFSVRHCFTGDYYPLTRWSLDQEVWMAWQFDRPDLGEGIVQAFRRAESANLTSQYRLRGLEVDAVYEVEDFDRPEKVRMAGRELMDEGVVVTIPDQPGAVVIRYRKVS